MTPEQKTAIQQDAERAARMGWTPNQMCPAWWEQTSARDIAQAGIDAVSGGGNA